MKRFLLLFLFVAGCAGTSRSCSSCNAESFGANWVVVQYRFDGIPINCWKISDSSITNEPHSDGIYWEDHGQLVHISGWYNRVQVMGNDYERAAKSIGVEISRCSNGAYAAPTPAPSASSSGGAK